MTASTLHTPLAMAVSFEQAEAELEQQLKEAKEELKEAKQQLKKAEQKLKETEQKQEQVQRKLMETEQTDPASTAEIQRLEQQMQRMRIEFSQLQSSFDLKHASVLSEENLVRRLESQLPVIVGRALASAGAASAGEPLSEDDRLVAFWRGLADDTVQFTTDTLAPFSLSELMTLPVDVYLFGGSAFGSKLYVRLSIPSCMRRSVPTSALAWGIPERW